MIFRGGIALFAVVLWELAGVASASAQGPPARGSGSIEGVVVDKATGEPVRAAEVATARPNSNVYIRTRTDGLGRFRLRALGPGGYELHMTHPLYLRAWGVESGGAHVQLADGEERKGLRIELARPAAISGLVLDELGEPLAGVRLQAVALKRSQGKIEPAPRGLGATTDDRGEFRLAGLPAGRYTIRAEFPGAEAGGSGAIEWQPALDDPEGRRLSMFYPPSYYPNADSIETAALFPLAAGEERGGVVLRLEPKPGFSVSGVVIDPGHRPGAYRGAPTLRPIGRDFGLGLPGPQYQDPDGRFEFRRVPPGRYLLTAVRRDDARRGGAWREIDVTNGSVEGVTLEMQDGVPVSGRVVFDGLSALPAGLRGPYVSLRSEVSSDFGVGSEADLTSGSFRIAGAVPTNYQVQATASSDYGGRSYHLKQVLLGGSPLAGERLEVGPGGVEGLLLVLVPDATVSGVVVDSTGSPAPGVRVLLGVESPGLGLSNVRAAAGDAGFFEIKHLTPQPVVLFALDEYDPDEDDDEDLARRLRGKGTKLTLEPGGDHVLQLELIRRRDLGR